LDQIFWNEEASYYKNPSKGTAMNK